MLNFSSISNATAVGRALRRPLRAIPNSTVVPILQGPLRGAKWTIGSGNHGCWLGSYELSKQNALAKLIRPGWVCWDIGANVGFYTLLFSRLTGPTGRVLAFEPSARNYSRLQRHVALNQCSNVHLKMAAMGEVDGQVGFNESLAPSMGFLDDAGAVRVECHRFDTLLQSGFLAPQVIKIDVEGAEAAVLRGASVLRDLRPILFIATHGARVKAECLGLLREMSYSVTLLDGRQGPLEDELIATFQG